MTVPPTPTPSGSTRPTPEVFLFLPQMRLGLDAIVERARAAEVAGFDGMAFMDHLAPPLADTQPMFEAMTTATWVAAHTSRLVVGHLVLCDALRHPAVLARQAVTLDHASSGRFELGIGWGSVPDELVTFGVTDDGPRARVERLGETLELVTALWNGGPVQHDGAHFKVDSAGQAPTPLDRIPIVVGGAGPRTMDLVERFADWWNVPLHLLDRLEEMRPRAGTARVSTQHMVTFVPRGADRAEIEALARKRFGTMGGGVVAGDASELVDHFGALEEQGIERFYLWFTDFAPPDTLLEVGETVIGPLRSTG
jgi:alkanesulfonate monooxygenase SsuD/methylene tetrahydromethanopterin reductase-like flavin-dependent oxidoreductase (luciferase family)